MVIRWLVAAFFFGVAVYVWDFNTNGVDRQILFPGLSAFVGPDLHAQGRLTWQILIGMGALVAVGNVGMTIAERRRREGE